MLPAFDPDLPLPDAVLWDMDGTLIDTEPCWVAAEYDLVAAHGGTWSQALSESLTGQSLIDSGRALQAAGVALEPGQIAVRMTELVVTRIDEAAFMPGALELLADLAAARVPCALVTASYRTMVDAIVARTPPGSFRAVVTGDEVERGKPDPEPYLRAAAALGVDPGRCVAIEDSVPGATAALAAGAPTVGVGTTMALPPLPGLSRVPSLRDITLADLIAVRHGRVLDRVGP